MLLFFWLLRAALRQPDKEYVPVARRSRRLPQAPQPPPRPFVDLSW